MVSLNQLAGMYMLFEERIGLHDSIPQPYFLLTSVVYMWWFCIDVRMSMLIFSNYI